MDTTITRRDMKPVFIFLNEELKEQLRRRARETHRSMSGYIRYLIERDLDDDGHEGDEPIGR